MVTFVRNNFKFGLMVLEQISFKIYFILILALVAYLYNGVEPLHLYNVKRGQYGNVIFMVKLF